MDAYNLRHIVEVYSAHPFLNHTLTPNTDEVRPAHANINIPSYRLRTNSLGFRFDEKRFREKRPGAFRIAILGDSHVEGYQEEFTLPYLLEKKLSARKPRGRKLEAMNFGVASYSALIHYVNLQRNVLQYHPDLVVLHFDMTDIFDDNVRYKDLTSWDKDGNPESVGPNISLNLNIDGHCVSTFDYGAELAARRPLYSPRRARIWLLDNSHLFLFFYFKTHSPGQIVAVYFNELRKVNPKISDSVKGGNTLQWCTDYADPRLQAQIEFSFGILDKIQALLRRNKIPLVITTLPCKIQLQSINRQPRWPLYPLQRIAAFCRSRNLPFYCPLQEFAAALRTGTELYYSDDMHLNNQGQELWAESLARDIASLF